MQTARVRLRPVLPADYEALYELLVHSPAAATYRFRGSTPSPDEFVELLWQAVTAQYVFEDRSTGGTIGLGALYGLQRDTQAGRIAVAIDTAHQRLGWPLEGAALLVDHAFASFPIRKIYLDVPEYNEGLVGGLERQGLAVVEGRLRGHSFHDGRWWDEFILAIWREEWERRDVLGKRRRAESG